MVFGAMVMLVAGLVVTIISGAQSAPCSSDTVSVNVTTTEDVQRLTDAMNCSGGGNFKVGWYGSLELGQRINVADHKHLQMAGFGYPPVSATLYNTNGSKPAIDAGDNDGIFVVSNRSTLTISHLVLGGGYSENGGAVAVLSSSILFVNDCTFTDNRADSGGAIYANGSKIYIDGTTQFFNNSAQDGGAIYANVSEVIIDGNTSFFHNSAESAGGAMYVDGSQVSIDGNTSFDHNIAIFSGGAMRAYESKVDITGETRFYNNTGPQFGGSISVIRAEMHINGTTTFAFNSAHEGGAVFTNKEAELSIDGNTAFTHNSASYVGGAMHITFAEANIGGNTSYEFNEAVFSGGAVRAEDSTVKIDGNTYLAHNKASSFGGGITTVHAEMHIDGTTHFLSNSAPEGGAMMMYIQSEVKITGNTTFDGNSASSYGGAIHTSESEVNIGGTASFSNNSASSYGGAINQIGGSLSVGGDSIFIANTGFFGGGVYAANGNLTFKENTRFIRNVAEFDGGAVAMVAPDKVNISGSTFLSNEARLGGAVSLTSLLHNQRIYHDCFFVNNTATDEGAMYLYGDAGVDVVTASFFRDNYASASGGAIYLVGTLKLSSARFVANKAGEEGTAIASVSVSSVVEFDDVSFQHNTYHCLSGEYGDDIVGTGTSRFDTACYGCSAVENQVPDGVQIARNDTCGIPSCIELPAGTVGLSSGTTVASLTLEAGYYRTSNESTVILECYRKEACVGGDEHGDYCAVGYEGAYCAVCADTFSSGTAYSCRECSEEAMRSAMGLALTAAVAMVVVAAMVLRHLSRVVDDETGERANSRQGFLARKCSLFQDTLMRVLPLSAIKIVVVVWQIVSQFSAIAGDVYPEEYETFLSYLSFASFDIGAIMSYSCLFSPDFYGRVLLSTIAQPIVLAALAGAFYFAKRRYRSSHKNILAVRGNFVSAALFFVFFVYSSVSYKILQTFLCDPLDDGEVYVQADYSLTCTTERHSAYTLYANVIVVVYPVGIPAFFFWWLLRNRKYLTMPDREAIPHIKPLSSISSTYTPSRYYFEVVECSCRLVLTMSSVFLVPNSVNQIATVLSLAAVFLFVSEWMSPFEKRGDMSLYRWGNGVVLASMFVALLLKANASTEQLGILSVFGGVLITANVVMIVTVKGQSVFLIKGWRERESVVEQVTLPVKRPISVFSLGTRSNHTAHTAPVRTDWQEDTF